MKDMQVSLKRMSFLSVVKNSNYLANNHVESDKEKGKCQNICLILLKGRKYKSLQFSTN